MREFLQGWLMHEHNLFCTAPDMFSTTNSVTYYKSNKKIIDEYDWMLDTYSLRPEALASTIETNCKKYTGHSQALDGGECDIYCIKGKKVSMLEYEVYMDCIDEF